MSKVALPIAVSCLALLCLAQPLSAHPIDEVKANAVVDLRSTDRQNFALTLYFEHRHLEEYTRIVRALGLAPERDREELARNMRNAFSFAPCTVGQPAVGPRFTERRAAPSSACTSTCAARARWRT